MPRLGPRLTRLEQTRPGKAAGLDLSKLDQPTLDAMAAAYAETLTCEDPDWTDPTLAGLLARMERIQADGLGLDHLSDGQLELIVAAGDAMRARA